MYRSSLESCKVLMSSSNHQKIFELTQMLEVSHLTLLCGLFYSTALVIFMFLSLTLITDQLLVLHTVLSQSLSMLSAQISILLRLSALHPARLPLKQWVEQPLQHAVQQLAAVALGTARPVLSQLILTPLQASLAQSVSAGQQQWPFNLAAWAQGAAGGWRGWRGSIVWHYGSSLDVVVF